jgi:predicted transcriptional regulator of viral defense system
MSVEPDYADKRIYTMHIKEALKIGRTLIAEIDGYNIPITEDQRTISDALEACRVMANQIPSELQKAFVDGIEYTQEKLYWISYTDAKAEAMKRYGEE